MKKKTTAVLVTLAAALMLGGCTSTSTTISSSVAQANPWEDFKTLEEAQEAVGFEVSLPDMSDFGDEETYRVCAALNELEVQYATDDEKQAYIRKAKDNGDISGDYVEYAFTGELKVGDDTLTVKGESEDELNLAVWTVGDYAYCIGITQGVDSETMEGLVLELE